MSKPTFYKIYRYVQPEFATDREKHPSHIIFPDRLLKSLPKKKTIYMGERINSTWYDSWDETNGFQDEIVKIDYIFNRDSDGLIISKTKTVSWMLESGQWSDITQVDTLPTTNTLDKLMELKKRRQNIIAEVESLSKDIGLETAIKEMFSLFLTEIGLYAESGSTALRDAVLNDTTITWMDNPTPSDPNITIRQFLYTYFSVGLDLSS